MNWSDSAKNARCYNKIIRHSSEFNKLRGDVIVRSATVQYNELPACAAFATVRFLLTKVPCNVTLKCTIFYKLIKNFIITFCIHYTVILSVMGLYCVSVFSCLKYLSVPAAAWKWMWVYISVVMVYMISQPKLSDKRYCTKQCHKIYSNSPPYNRPLFYALVVFLEKKKLDVNPKGIHKKW